MYGWQPQSTDASRDGDDFQLQKCRNFRTMQSVGTSRNRIVQSTDAGRDAAKRSGSRRKGRPPKLGKHQLFSLRLPAELHRALKTYAFVKGRSFNDVITDVIQTWWREQAEREHIEALVRMGHDKPGAGGSDP